MTQRPAHIVQKTIKACTRFVQQLLFPLKCLQCGCYLFDSGGAGHHGEDYFCPACFGKGIFFPEPPYCSICGMVFPSRAGENHVCEACIKKPLLLGKVRAAVQYRGIMKKAVPLFKYRAKKSLLNLFEPMLFKTFQVHFAHSGVDLLIPVPLHRQKGFGRGFNQACLLIRHFEKWHEKENGGPPPWHVDILSLVRVKKTAPQTGFDTRARKQNVRGAFSVKRPDRIKDKHILLVDDVFTTGAACNEAAKELLKKGAGRVDALVLART